MRNLLIILFYIPILGLIYGWLAVIFYRNEFVKMISDSDSDYPILPTIWLVIQIISGIVFTYILWK